jgi:hypothetical protein
MSIKDMSQEIQKTITDKLKDMGCENIIITEKNSRLISVVFDCKEITSFKTEIKGWGYSGIKLDATGQHYQIDFQQL